MSKKSIDARRSRVYYPNSKELQRLSRLHSTLTRIAVDKKQGIISHDKAIDKATAATAKLMTAEQLKKNQQRVAGDSNLDAVQQRVDPRGGGLHAGDVPRTEEEVAVKLTSILVFFPVENRGGGSCVKLTNNPEIRTLGVSAMSRFPIRRAASTS